MKVFLQRMLHIMLIGYINQHNMNIRRISLLSMTDLNDMSYFAFGRNGKRKLFWVPDSDSVSYFLSHQNFAVLLDWRFFGRP